MQSGYRFRLYPTAEQKTVLLRWIGCQRFIYNAKVAEDRYFRAYARKFASHQHVPVDQEYSRFIGPDTAWLRAVPSQVLRNGAVRWRQAYQRFFRKLSGRPKFRKAQGAQSVWLTAELFRFSDTPGGLCLHVGTARCPVGELSYVAHRRHNIPASIHITVDAGRWYVSFSTADGEPEYDDAEIVAWLGSFDREELRERAVGVDRGTVIPVAASNGQDFQFRPVERKRVRRKERAIKRWQRKLARRRKDSVRRRRARQRIAALRRYQADLRWDFAHQTSRKLADDPRALLFVFEDLQIQNMTASAKGTAEAPGQRVRQKSGLNRAILASAWGRIKANLAYKARRAHKLLIEVPPFHSSQECRMCGHIHQDNRITQSRFVCQACGHTENADRNASHILAGRGVELILSGRWKPRERKRVKMTASGTRQVRSEGPEPEVVSISYERGESVRRRHRTVPAQGSTNRETPATTLRV